MWRRMSEIKSSVVPQNVNVPLKGIKSYYNCIRDVCTTIVLKNHTLTMGEKVGGGGGGGGWAKTCSQRVHC